MKFSAAFVVLSCALGALAVTTSQFLTDIQAITTQTQALDAKIKTITTSNIAGALAVHTAAGNLLTSINMATSDANAITPIPVSETDGATILNAVQALSPIIIGTLSDLTAKNATIAAIPITGLFALVLQDVENLSTATGALETSLMAASPADIQAEAMPIMIAINDAFCDCIAAF